MTESLSPEYVKTQGWLIFESISGSRAYDLANIHSDTDIKGVFVLPPERYYGLDDIEQVSNDSNDIVYYELKKFASLLAKSNPNILELLYTDEKSILYEHPTFTAFKAGHFLSKQCYQTFAGYAFSQIRKAQGLNKKVLNPLPKRKKEVLDFCFIATQNASIPLRDWLKTAKYSQTQCGLASLPHFKNVYVLYYDAQNKLGYKGIIQSPHSNEVSLSAIPKAENFITYLYFNQEGYSSYCREYREYWEWVEKRNDTRYQGTLAHGKGYDAKNMMHTFRLLDMAEQIASEQKITLRSQRRQELLDIKAGKYDYEVLIQKAQIQIQSIEKKFEEAELPQCPDTALIEKITVQIRNQIYQNQT